MRYGKSSMVFTRLTGVAAAALAAGLMGAGEAQAQAVGSDDTTFVVSYAESLVFNPATTTTTTITNSSTQIIGRLSGGAPLYDQTFGVPFADPAAQAGVVAARGAVTTAGGPGVIIGAPVLTASSSNTTSTSVTVYSLAGTRNPDDTTVITFGPATVAIGQLSTCNVAGLPGATRPSCQPLPGTPYNLAPFSTNFNTTRYTEYLIDETTQTTNTTTNVEQYTLTGIVRRVGSVHGIAPQAAGNTADLFSTRLRDAGREPRAWLSGYGWKGKRDAQGDVPSDRRSAEGVSGGIAFDLAPGLTGGVGFDAGRVHLRLPEVGERATIDLTQFGAYLGWSGGDWFVRGSGAFGNGHAETTTAPSDIAITASGRNGVRTGSLSAEAGRDFSAGGWTVTPSVGGQWLRVRSGGLTETGNFALMAEASTLDLAKGWAGIAAQREFGPATISGYARLTVQDNDRVAIPVRFAGIDADMTLDGPDLGTTGGETGIAATVRLGSNAVAFAGYDARLRDGLALHSGAAGVRMSF